MKNIVRKISSFLKNILLPAVIFGITAIMALVTELAMKAESLLSAITLGAVLVLCILGMVLSIFAPVFVWHFKLRELERTQL